MIYEDTADFLAALPPMQSLAGLDLGTQTIGVAVSDTFLSVATPLETIRRRKFSTDAAALAQIVAQRRIGKCGAVGALYIGVLAIVGFAVCPLEDILPVGMGWFSGFRATWTAAKDHVASPHGLSPAISKRSRG